LGVEIIVLWIVIGGRGDDNEIGSLVGILLIEGGPEIEFLVLDEIFNLGIDNRKFPGFYEPLAKRILSTRSN